MVAAEARGRGGAGDGDLFLMDIEFQFCKMKRVHGNDDGNKTA